MEDKVLVVERSQKDDVGSRRDSFDLARGADAVDLRECDLEHGELRPLLPGAPDGRCPVARFGDYAVATPL
ncbi:MAG TPA: hypothetical protein VFU41_04990 [Gemmatimonadales bacterium]|nr:hypothetical protein [Gemmatimonadales bacterium]